MEKACNKTKASRSPAYSALSIGCIVDGDAASYYPR